MSAPDCPAWWCPACCVGVELGDEAWSGTLVPIPGETEPECGDCGTELEVHPELPEPGRPQDGTLAFEAAREEGSQ